MTLNLVIQPAVRRGAVALTLALLASARVAAAQSVGITGGQATVSSPQQEGFAVGDRVEVQHTSGDWRVGTVVRASPSACTYYTVRYDAYGNGPAELGFSCGSVRAVAARAAAPAPARATLGGALSLGAYTCDHKPSANAPARQMGTITLRDGGAYRFLKNGGGGRYRYDAASGAITWLSGPLHDRRPARTIFRRNRNTAQVDILFSGVYEWSCGRNL